MHLLQTPRIQQGWLKGDAGLSSSHWQRREQKEHFKERESPYHFWKHLLRKIVDGFDHNTYRRQEEYDTQDNTSPAREKKVKINIKNIFGVVNSPTAEG